MAEIFDIPVTYKGQELSFKAELQKLGYIYKIVVDFKGDNVSFEQDEESSYRAFVNTYETSAHNIDIALLKAEGEILEQQRTP
jgi:hypothetical protein